MRAALRVVVTTAFTLGTAPLLGQQPEPPSSATAASQPAAEAPALTDAQRALVEQLIEQRLQALPPPQPPELQLSWKGDSYTKFIFRNNQSNGCVSYGNPHPKGDNFAGENGICSELGLTVNGKVSRSVEVQARLQSRYGQEWADWYENGERQGKLDTTGESLGMNHGAYLQLRGVYVRLAPPIPTIKYIHLGASDLSQYNAFTIGKVRYIDRFNASGVFLVGDLFGVAGYEVARIALPKLFASANWNTGIDDQLVANPFWTRDAAYALKLTGSPFEVVDLKFIAAVLLDEEADTDDPDALGSINPIDPRDGVVQTNPRYLNGNATLEAQASPLRWLSVQGLFGLSYSKPDPELVFNGVAGNQGMSPVPMRELTSYAAIAHAEVSDPFDVGLSLKLEYFNIGADWVATFGARRETDVLLTDGIVGGGQVATLNVANEFMDFTDPFFESVVGWHGITAVLDESWGAAAGSIEGTYLTYNTNGQGRDVDTIYPDFLATDGQTDTDHFSYANTSDRGRDPRSVYHRNQSRQTVIAVAKASYALDLLSGITPALKLKYIYDLDRRDTRLQPDPSADDYLGHLLTAQASVKAGLTQHLGLELGYQLDAWFEQHRSGEVIAGVADYPDYTTWKHKVWGQASYLFEGFNFGYRIEWLNKDLTTTKPALDQQLRNIVRSVGSVSVSF